MFIGKGQIVSCLDTKYNHKIIFQCYRGERNTVQQKVMLVISYVGHSHIHFDLDSPVTLKALTWSNWGSSPRCSDFVKGFSWKHRKKVICTKYKVKLVFSEVWSKALSALSKESVKYFWTHYRAANGRAINLSDARHEQAGPDIRNGTLMTAPIITVFHHLR